MASDVRYNYTAQIQYKYNPKYPHCPSLRSFQLSAALERDFFVLMLMTPSNEGPSNSKYARGASNPKLRHLPLSPSIPCLLPNILYTDHFHGRKTFGGQFCEQNKPWRVDSKYFTLTGTLEQPLYCPCIGRLLAPKVCLSVFLALA